MNVNFSKRAIAIFLAALMIIGIFAAFPTIFANAVETNYALTAKYMYDSIAPKGYAQYADDTWSGAKSGDFPTEGAYGTGDLNNGVTATGTYTDTAWVAWLFTSTGTDTAPNYVTILFDLQSIKADVAKVKFSLLTYSTTATVAPSTVTVNYSTDSDLTFTGTKTGTGVSSGSGNTKKCTYTVDLGSVAARYIQIHIPKSSERVFIDEIFILSGVNETPDISDSNSSSEKTQTSKFDVIVDAPTTAEQGSTMSVYCYIRNITATNGLVGVDFSLSFSKAILKPKYTSDSDIAANYLYKAPTGRFEDAGTYYNESAGKIYVRFCDKDGTTAYGIKTNDALVFKIDFEVLQTAAAGITATINVTDCLGTDPGNASWEGFGEVTGTGSSDSFTVKAGTPNDGKLILKSTATNCSISSSKVYGVAEKQSVSQVKQLFEGMVEIELIGSSSYVGTGCIVKAVKSNGSFGETAVIIVKGDVDGTGVVDATDIIAVKRYMLSTYDFSENARLAANTDNSNNVVDSADYIQIKRHLMNTYNLYK